MSAAVVLLLGLVVAGCGLALVWRGRLSLGAEGKPGFNMLVLLRRQPVSFHPVTARVLGVLLIAVGVGSVLLALRELGG